MSTTFAGFVPPVDDYFRMPNEWINICAEIDNLAELKIIQYVLRHTWGYQEYDGIRKITIDEFMYGRKRKDGTRIDKGTGLSKQSVITGVERAIEHGFLVCQKDDKDSARKKRYYHLNMRSDVKDLDISDVKDLDIDLKTDVKDLDPDVKDLDSRGLESRQRTEKDTIERHLEKDKKSVSPSPEMTANVSTLTPSEINVSSEFASHLPQGNDEKPIPPNPDKAQVNGQTYPWMTMLDQWDKDYNGGRRSKRDSLTLRHAREWMVEMKLTYQDAKVVRQKIIEHNLHRGKPITFTMIYDHSEWLGEIPEASVHQNGQGKHATSTPLDTERNERNLQNLLKRAAEKRAAQATKE